MTETKSFNTDPPLRQKLFIYLFLSQRPRSEYVYRINHVDFAIQQEKMDIINCTANCPDITNNLRQA